MSELKNEFNRIIKDSSDYENLKNCDSVFDGFLVDFEQLNSVAEFIKGKESLKNNEILNLVRDKKNLQNLLLSYFMNRETKLYIDESIVKQVNADFINNITFVKEKFHNKLLKKSQLQFSNNLLLDLKKVYNSYLNLKKAYENKEYELVLNSYKNVFNFDDEIFHYQGSSISVLNLIKKDSFTIYKNTIFSLGILLYSAINYDNQTSTLCLKNNINGFHSLKNLYQSYYLHKDSNKLIDAIFLMLKKLTENILNGYSIDIEKKTKNDSSSLVDIQIKFFKKKSFQLNDILESLQQFISVVSDNLPEDASIQFKKTTSPTISNLFLNTVLSKYIDPQNTSKEFFATLENFTKPLKIFEDYMLDKKWISQKIFSEWLRDAPILWYSKKIDCFLQSCKLLISTGPQSFFEVDNNHITRILKKIPRDNNFVLNTTTVLNKKDNDNDESNNNINNKNDTNSDKNNKNDTDSDKNNDPIKIEGNIKKSDSKESLSSINSSDFDAWSWSAKSENDDNKIVKKDEIETKQEAFLINNKTNNNFISLILNSKNIKVTNMPDDLFEMINKLISFKEIEFKEHWKDQFENISSKDNFNEHLEDMILLYACIGKPLYKEKKNKDEDIGMLLVNDYLYLSHLICCGYYDKETDEKNKIRYDKLVKLIDRLANEACFEEIESKKREVIELCVQTRGFVTCTEEERESACDESIYLTVSLINNTALSWSSLPKDILHRSLGIVIDTVLDYMINSIEFLGDISAQESEKLVNYIEDICSLETHFPSSTEEESEFAYCPAVYCSNWIKFNYLREILEGNLERIKELYLENALIDFTKQELVGLIKGLFIDSQKRRDLINIINM